MYSIIMPLLCVNNAVLAHSTWLPEKSWNEFCRLDGESRFNGVRAHFTKNMQAWKKIYDDLVSNLA